MQTCKYDILNYCAISEIMHNLLNIRNLRYIYIYIYIYITDFQCFTENRRFFHFIKHSEAVRLGAWLFCVYAPQSRGPAAPRPHTVNYSTKQINVKQINNN